MRLCSLGWGLDELEMRGQRGNLQVMSGDRSSSRRLVMRIILATTTLYLVSSLPDVLRLEYLQATQPQYRTKTDSLNHGQLQLPQYRNRQNIDNHIGDDIQSRVGEVESIDVDTRSFNSSIPQHRYRNAL